MAEKKLKYQKVKSYYLHKLPTVISPILIEEYFGSGEEGNVGTITQGQAYQVSSAEGTYQNWTGTIEQAQSFQVSESGGAAANPLTGEIAQAQAYQISQAYDQEPVAIPLRTGTRKRFFLRTTPIKKQQPIEPMEPEEVLLPEPVDYGILGMAVSYAPGQRSEARGLHGYYGFSRSAGKASTVEAGGRIVTAEDELLELMVLLNVA
jgi:hypothetical protein